jgi:dTMP kinase
MIKKTFEYVFDKSKKFDNILVTDEPTNGPFGKKVRELFKQQKSPNDLAEEIFQAFCADREWHINNVIKPALEKDFVVIADRYKYGGIAYQTVQGSSFERVLAANKLFLAPDLALLLDVEPKEALRRISSASDAKRKQSDNFREFEFVSSLRKFFVDMPKFLPGENIHLIDANKPVPVVFEQIRPLLDKVLE